MTSIQAKVFTVTFVAAHIIELIGETTLYGLIPSTACTCLKTRFWTHYVVSLSLTMLFGLFCRASIDCLAKSGWTKTAWVAAIVPTILILSGAYMLHGVDTILGVSSGTGSVGLIKAAYKAKKK